MRGISVGIERSRLDVLTGGKALPMRRICSRMVASGMLLGVGLLAGCSSTPPDFLTEEQLAAQAAAEKQALADEDAAEAEFQKSQRKQRR